MADIYVNFNSGSDSGTGASGDPLRTFTAAHSAAGTNDTIYCRGTYRGQMKITKSNLTVRVWSGYTATIDGARSDADAAAEIYTYPDYGTLTKYGNFPPYGFSHGHVWAGLLDISGNNVDVYDIFVTHSRGRAITVADCSNIGLYNVSGHANRHAILGTKDTDSVTMDGGYWTENINYAPFPRPGSVLNFPGAINTSRDTNITIRNVTIHTAWGSAIIMLMAENCLVENNTCIDAWHPGINVSLARNCTVRNNYVYYTNDGSAEAAPSYGGIAVFPETGFLPWERSEGIYIYNNIVVGAKDACWLGGNKPDAQHNLGVDDLFIYNNQFLDSLRYSVHYKRSYHDLTFKNNIVSSTKAELVKQIQTPSSLTVSNNIWYPGTPRSNWRGSGDVYNQSPLLAGQGGTIPIVNPVERYFIGSSSSPAINAGTATISVSPAVSAPTTDYRGATRSTVDIGAHEYDGAISPIINCTGNVLTNHAFTSGTTGWTSSEFDSFTVTGGVARLQDADGATFNQIYQESISVSSGATYGVEFDARSATAGTLILLQCLQDNSPFANLGLNKSFSLTTTMARYKLEFIANATESDSRFRFNLPNGGDVYLDNVCFYLGKPADPEPPDDPIGGEGNVIARVAVTTSAADADTEEVRDDAFVGAPVAALSLAGIAGSDARVSMGYTAADDELVGGVRMEDASATSDTRSLLSNDHTVYLLDNNTTNLAHALRANLVEGGLDYVKAGTPAEAATVLTWLLGGEDVQAAAGWFTSSATDGGTYSVTGLDFQPNLILFQGYDYPFSATTSTSNARISWGFATSEGNQYCYALTDFNNVNPTSVSGRLSTDCIHFYHNDSQKIVLSSIESNGFTVTTTDASNAKEIAYWAVRVENATVALETFTAPTTASTKSIDVAFTPASALILQTRLTALDSTNSATNAGMFSIGLLDDTSEQSISLRTRDAVTPSDTQVYVASDVVNVYTQTGTQEQVANGALTSTGVDLVYSAVNGSATYGIILAIEYVEPKKNRQKLRHLRQGMRLGMKMGW